MTEEKYHYMIHGIVGNDSGYIHTNKYLGDIIEKFTKDQDAFILILSKEGYEHIIKKKESI